MNPFINPKNRSVSLLAGCKDLIEVLEQKSASHEFKTGATHFGFVITAYMPGLRSEDVEITVEGATVRIIGKRTENRAAFESDFYVPSGFNITNARAAYLNGELRIIIPKSDAQSAL